MWILNLNDMRSPKVEILTPVARAETREALLALLAREQVDGYRDGQWGKTYKQGGPLEWYNPPYEWEAERHFVQIISKEAALARTAREYDDYLARDIYPLMSVDVSV